MNANQLVSGLRESIGVAAINFDIWWVYKDRKHRSIYTPVMNRYLPFFTASLHAHFVATVSSIYHLYEIRADTLNFQNLFRELEKLPSFDKTVLENARETATLLKPIWVKIGILRNNVFGHRNAARSPLEIFSRAGITPDQIREIIEASMSLINSLSEELDGTVHAFNLRGTDSTVELLSDLSSLRE